MLDSVIENNRKGLKYCFCYTSARHTKRSFPQRKEKQRHGENHVNDTVRVSADTTTAAPLTRVGTEQFVPAESLALNHALCGAASLSRKTRRQQKHPANVPDTGFCGSLEKVFHSICLIYGICCPKFHVFPDGLSSPRGHQINQQRNQNDN